MRKLWVSDGTVYFTEAGTRALRMYECILQSTQSYLTRLGVSEESRQESLRQLIENVDYELLLSITRSDTQVKKRHYDLAGIFYAEFPGKSP